jgi:lysophospholipase L1-like esterase
MRRNPLRVAAALAALVVAGAACGTRTAPSPAAAPHPFEEDIHQFEAADRRAPPPTGAVLFVGSSSIRMWETLAQDFPGVPTINRGFGGSQLGDVVYFADRIILPYKPRVIVVYAGDNDLEAGRSPHQVLSDFEQLVIHVLPRLPEARILFVSIKPSIARWRLVDEIREANALVRDYTTRDKRLVYVDVFTPMLDERGQPRPELFLEDGLHMNAKGYAIWRERIAPLIR